MSQVAAHHREPPLPDDPYASQNIENIDISIRPGSIRRAVEARLTELRAAMSGPETRAGALGELREMREAGLIDRDSDPLVRKGPEMLAECSALLVKHQVPIETWGRGAAKGLENFMDELERGESRLELEDGRLCRTIEVVRVDVFYEVDGRLLHLKELAQLFRDNRMRSRNSPYSVGEKLLPGETHREGAVRALREELGISGPVELEGGSMTGHIGECADYPGLPCKKLFTNFAVFLTPEQYHPDGYIEVTPEKLVAFVWRDVELTRTA